MVCVFFVSGVTFRWFAISTCIETLVYILSLHFVEMRVNKRKFTTQLIADG